MNNLNAILDIMLKEKKENEKRANVSECNDYYVGYGDGISFAINAVKEYINNIIIPIDPDDIESILEREG